MRVPFPNITSGLAVSAHMYICVESGTKKTLVKCQTKKPHHLINGSKPLARITEKPNSARNPFKTESIIDCDKNFLVENIILPLKMRTDIRSDVCDELFQDILMKISHPNLIEHNLDTSDVLKLNNLATLAN